MPTVKQVIDAEKCSTIPVLGLSYQIIAEMNLLVPNVLVNCEDLNIKANSPAAILFMQPAAKEALRRALQSGPDETLVLNSVYRTVAQQYVLRRWYEKGQRCGIRLAARPGRSNHEDGLALDTSNHLDSADENETNRKGWRTSLEAEKWDWLGPRDRVHFTFIGTGVRDEIGDIGVKAFQQLWNKHHPDDKILDDGLFGTQTANRMDQSPAEGFNTPRLLKLVDPPMEGDDVRKVQQALVNVELLEDSDINGIYDEKTAEAVAKLQEQRELSVDRIVGPQTRRRLGILRS